MIEIVIGSIEHIDEFAEIYKKFLYNVYSQSNYDSSEIENLISKVEQSKKLHSALKSPLCRTLFVRKNNKIRGFIEAYIAKNDYMFEKEHIYIANLFFLEECLKDESTFDILYQLYNAIIKWSKDNHIKYICNDVDEQNSNMILLNKLIKFKAYRTRYFKEIE